MSFLFIFFVLCLDTPDPRELGLVNPRLVFKLTALDITVDGAPREYPYNRSIICVGLI